MNWHRRSPTCQVRSLAGGQRERGVRRDGCRHDRGCGRRDQGKHQSKDKQVAASLSYASQQQTALYRGLEQARKIRMRLGGSADLLELFPARPKGMHRRTFQRLRARAQAAMFCL